MEANFHVMTPLVRIRETTFSRTCVRRSADEWLVFDLPTNDYDQQLPFIRGCLVRKPNVPGISRVTWMELAQYRLLVDGVLQVPTAYVGLLENGRGFGSLRWFETLARECRRPSIYSYATASCFFFFLFFVEHIYWFDIINELMFIDLCTQTCKRKKNSLLFWLRG